MASNPQALVLTSPANVVDIWPVGEPDPAQMEAYVAAVVAFAGLPPDWDGITGGWTVEVASMPLHPSRLVGATLHDGPPT